MLITSPVSISVSISVLPMPSGREGWEEELNWNSHFRIKIAQPWNELHSDETKRKRKWERERVCVCACVREKATKELRTTVCVCGCAKRERERERERLKLVLRGTASDVTSWGDHTGHEENRLSWHLFKRWKVVSELLQRASLARVMALSRPGETSLKISQRQKKTLVVIRTLKPRSKSSWEWNRQKIKFLIPANAANSAVFCRKKRFSPQKQTRIKNFFSALESGGRH